MSIDRRCGATRRSNARTFLTLRAFTPISYGFLPSCAHLTEDDPNQLEISRQISFWRRFPAPESDRFCDRTAAIWDRRACALPPNKWEHPRCKDKSNQHTRPQGRVARHSCGRERRARRAPQTADDTPPQLLRPPVATTSSVQFSAIAPNGSADFRTIETARVGCCGGRGTL
jgi:hypothetical protein